MSGFLSFLTQKPYNNFQFVGKAGSDWEIA